MRRYREIISLSWPAILEQLLYTVTQMVDLAMVGGLGAAAVAAVGLAMQPMLVFQAVFMGLGAAGTALVARYTGAQEPLQAQGVLRLAFLLSAALAAVMGGFVAWQAPHLVALMGAGPDVAPLGVGYLRAMAPGLAAVMVSGVLAGALRGAGDARTPLLVNLLVNMLHLVSNWALIYGHLGAPALGVVGAGISTSLARWTGLAVMFWLLAGGRLDLRLHWRRPVPEASRHIADLLRIGLPVTFERLFLSLALVVYIRLIAGLGTAAYAAYNIAVNAEALSYMPAFGVSLAAAALVGQSLGARRPEEARRYGWLSVQVGTAFMGIMALLFFLAPEPLIRIYTGDPEILRIAAHGLQIAAAAQLFMGLAIVLGGALRGAGDTRPMMWASAISIWVMRVGLAYWLIYRTGWGVSAAWCAMTLDWISRAAFATWRFMGSDWIPAYAQPRDGRAQPPRGRPAPLVCRAEAIRAHK